MVAESHELKSVTLLGLIFDMYYALLLIYVRFLRFNQFFSFWYLNYKAIIVVGLKLNWPDYSQLAILLLI